MLLGEKTTCKRHDDRSYIWATYQNLLYLVFYDLAFVIMCLLMITFLAGVVLEAGKRYASLDGDADRVVFFFEDNGESILYCILPLCPSALGSFRLLDGDKIASLVIGIAISGLITLTNNRQLHLFKNNLHWLV